MGEIADMMLDGTLCEECGSYIGEAKGHPVRCDDCKKINRIMKKCMDRTKPFKKKKYILVSNPI